ncbi:MAG: hypothetical protein GKR87_11010 [Kiritimatiellae bacterium]|nr:hypothetical protein [Kiritimatiellia bacterium]
MNINQAEGINGHEVYHPRWSNHPRFLVMTGPYVEGEGGNKIGGGGKRVEIYAGRFSPDYDKVEHWLRITDNKKGDFYPDLWIHGAVDNVATSPPRSVPPPKSVSKEQHIVHAQCVETYTLPNPENIGVYDRALAVNRYRVEEVETGSFKGKTLFVAQWLIRDRKLVKSIPSVGVTYRLILENFYAHPDLEGERLLIGPIMDPEADIYIDVSQEPL